MTFTREYDKVIAIMDSLEEKADKLREKMEEIEDRACERDRDMTEKEQEKYDALEEKVWKIEEWRTEECLQALQNRQSFNSDWIKDYAEDIISELQRELKA